MKRLGSLVLSAALFLSGAACGGQRAREVSFPKGVSAGLFAMDTYLSLTAYGEKAEGTLEQAQERIRELESLWSVTDEHSEIYAANHSGGEAVAVSEDTAHLVRPPGAAWCRPPLSARKANGVTPFLWLRDRKGGRCK